MSFFRVASIDVGNLYSVVGIPYENGVDILSSCSSGRLIPSMVTITNERRYTGESAHQQQLQYIESTVSQFKRLIALPYASNERKYLSQVLDIDLKPLKDGFTGIRFLYRENSIVLRPEQLLAKLLKDLEKITIESNKNVQQYVITINQWWKENQRRAIYYSGNLAGMNIIGLANTTIAAAIAYTKIHVNKLIPGTPLPILFLDFGHAAFNVALCKCAPNYVEVVSYAHNNDICGSYISIYLTNFLIQRVRELYPDVADQVKKPRIFHRFREAVTKVKHNLFINQMVYFDLIISDVHVNFPVTIGEFNTILEPILQMIERPINEVLSYSKIMKEQLESIQLLGGSSRVQAIRDKLSTILGKEPSGSLNLDECVAIGAGHYAASLDSLNTQSELIILDVLPFEISAAFPNGKSIVFPKFSRIPNTMETNVNFTDLLIITFLNDQDEICQLTLSANGTVEAILRIVVDINCLIDFNVSSNVSMYVSRTYDINQSELEWNLNIEHEMENNDTEQFLIDEIKNNIEVEIFKVQNAFEDTEFIKYFSQYDVETKVPDIIDWYESSKNIRRTISEFENQYNILKKINDSATNRRNIYTQLNLENEDLKQRILNRIKMINGNSEKEVIARSHFYDVLETINQTFELPLYADPYISVEIANQQIEMIEQNLVKSTNDQKEKNNNVDKRFSMF